MRKKVYPILVIFFGIAAVHAGEDVCSDPKDREFDFWIGEWDVENRQANPGNPSDANLYPTGSAVAKVFPVAGGCGVVELWQGELSWGTVRGFSLRSYDASTDKWTLLLNWPAPNAPVPAAFTMRDGEFRHGRGQFFSSRIGADGETVHSRFTFSDISEERYRWDGAASVDGRVNWQTTWVMEATRRDVAKPDALKPHLPADTDMKSCGEDDGVNSLAFLNGEWSGIAENETPIQLEVIPIMDGCAVLEFLSMGGDQPLEEFRVRTYQADSGSWIKYSVNNRSEGLVESSGDVSDREIEWSSRTREIELEDTRLDDDQMLRLRRKLPDGAILDARLTRR